jgi:hypothetical protein
MDRQQIPFQRFDQSRALFIRPTMKQALILRRPPELDNELNDKARIFITAITVR